MLNRQWDDGNQKHDQQGFAAEFHFKHVFTSSKVDMSGNGIAAHYFTICAFDAMSDGMVNPSWPAVF